jgi:acetyl-CoA synthetase
MSTSIESVLVETRVFPPPAEFVKQANVSGQAAYHALLEESDRDPTGFWARLARENLQWIKPFTEVLDETKAPFYRWFGDGELNVSVNCLDVNLKNGNANKVAIIFEADGGEITQVTYQQLYERVCKFANGLKSLGYKLGDRAIIYLPMSIEAVTAMQACARLGITHSVVFGGFSAKSLHERITDVGASLVITADEQMRGGRAIALKPAVDEALGMGACEAVRHSIVYIRTGGCMICLKNRRIAAMPLLLMLNILCLFCIPRARQVNLKAFNIRQVAIYCGPSSPCSGCSTRKQTMYSGVRPMWVGSPDTLTSFMVHWPMARRP